MTKIIPRIELIFLPPPNPVISIAGAGGKTTLMFSLAKLYGSRQTVTTTTTKVGAGQILQADACYELNVFPPAEAPRIMWVSPSLVPESGKIKGCSREEFTRLAGICKAEGFTLITESDGAAQKHIKAPAAHEPVHPAESDICIYVIGMDVLGEPVSSQTVHRPELFSRITGAEEGEPISAGHMIRLLEHPDGGLKGMPAGAVKIVHLTHADSRERMKTAEYIAEQLDSYQYLTYYR